MNCEVWNKFLNPLTLSFEYHDFECITFTPASLWTLTLILGQKGSGKSAILRMLHERAGKDMIIIDLSPQQYQWQNLRGSMEAGIPSPHAESLVWTASLTISLMNYIVQYAGYLDDPLQIIPQFRQFLVDLKLLR